MRAGGGELAGNLFEWLGTHFMVEPQCFTGWLALQGLYTVAFGVAALVVAFLVAAVAVKDINDASPAEWIGFLVLFLAGGFGFLWLGTRLAAALIDGLTNFAAWHGAPLVAFGFACWLVGVLCVVLLLARGWRRTGGEV